MISSLETTVGRTAGERLTDTTVVGQGRKEPGRRSTKADGHAAPHTGGADTLLRAAGPSAG